MNGMMFRPPMLRLALVSSLSLALAACGGGKQDADAGQSSVPVEVAAAAHAPISASYSGTAALEAEHEADVVAKASGAESLTPWRQSMCCARWESISSVRRLVASPPVTTRESNNRPAPRFPVLLCSDVPCFSRASRFAAVA